VGKGDAFAWDEAEIVFPERFLPLMSQLMEARNPVEELPSQLVHGDQGGNILFHPATPGRHRREPVLATEAVRRRYRRR
jgi:hypothetical protein